MAKDGDIDDFLEEDSPDDPTAEPQRGPKAVPDPEPEAAPEAEPPEAAAAPEAATDEPEEVEPEKITKRGDVNKALREAREKYKTLKAERTAAEAKYQNDLAAAQQAAREEARRDAAIRVQRIQEAIRRQQEEAYQQQQMAQQQQIPDPRQDPAAYQEWLGQHFQQREQNILHQQAQMQQQIEVSNLKNFAANVDYAGDREIPGYRDAVSHLAQVWAAEGQFEGVPQEELGQYVAQRLAGKIKASMQYGIPAHHELVKLAQRAGWQPRQAAPAAPTAAPAQRAAPQSPAAKQVAQVAAAQSRAAPTAPASRRVPPPPGDFTAEDLLNMDDDDFSRLSDKDFQRIVSG